MGPREEHALLMPAEGVRKAGAGMKKQLVGGWGSIGADLILIPKPMHGLIPILILSIYGPIPPAGGPRGNAEADPAAALAADSAAGSGPPRSKPSLFNSKAAASQRMLIRSPTCLRISKARPFKKHAPSETSRKAFHLLDEMSRRCLWGTQ